MPDLLTAPTEAMTQAVPASPPPYTALRREGKILHGSTFCSRCLAEVELMAVPGSPRRLFLQSEAEFMERHTRRVGCRECRTEAEWQSLRADRDRCWQGFPGEVER